MRIVESYLAEGNKPLGVHSYAYLILGQSLSKQAKFAEAFTAYERALEIAIQAAGGSELDRCVAMALTWMGMNKQVTGAYGEALGLFNRALSIRLEVLGKKHNDTLQSYQVLSPSLESEYARNSAHTISALLTACHTYLCILDTSRTGGRRPALNARKVRGSPFAGPDYVPSCCGRVRPCITVRTDRVSWYLQQPDLPGEIRRGSRALPYAEAIVD